MTGSEQAKAALAALAERERSARAGATDPDRTTGDGAGDSATATAVPAAETVADEQPTGAEPDADYRAVIERAVAATDDLDAAAAFVESVGLDGLERAVERAEREVSGLADDGREALVTFERFRVAAAGPVEE